MISQLNLIGREKEADELQSLLKQGNGYFILISGEVGIGKTLFVENVLKKNNINFYSARSIDSAASPYSLLTSILRSYLREQKELKIDFGPLTKFLSVLLPEISAEPEDVDKETLAQAVCDAFTFIASRKPFIIFLDDLHWSDNATIELLPSLSEKLDNTSVMILAAYRSDEISRQHKIRWMRNELRRRKKLYEFDLAPFNFEETAQLIKHLMNKKPSFSLVQVIHSKTQGTPLFIEELCNTIIDKKIIQIVNGEVSLKSEHNIPLPESISDAVLLKIHSISDNAKRLLEIAAVAGEEFDLNLFNGIAGSEEGLDELFHHSFIKETEQGKAEFKHTLIREAIKSEIKWNRRRELNIKIAEYFASHNYHPELVAFHWLEANKFENARKSFMESAKRSCDIQAYSDAARSASKALRLWPQGIDENERIDTLLQLAHCAQLSGDLDEAIRVLKEITETSHAENISLAKAYRLLATIYGLKSKWQYVADTRKKSAQHFEKENLFDDGAIEYLAAAARFTSLMDLNEALSCSKKAVELCEKVKNINIKSRAMGLQGNITAMLGNPLEGKAIVQKGLDLALQNNHVEAASEIYRRLASTMEYQSDYISARNAYNNAYNFCVTSGTEFYAQICLGCMSYIFFQTGDWKRALEVCNDVLQNKKSPEGSRNGAMGIKGLIHAFRGQIKSAEKYLNQSFRLAKKIQNNIVFFSISWGKGIIAEIENDTEKMLINYSEIFDLWNNFDDRHDSIPTLMWGANAFAKSKKEKGVITCIENLSMISNETSNPEALSALAFSLGEHSALKNKFNEALEKFEQSLLHQEKIFVPYEKMLIEYRLGEVLIKTGNNENALKHLSSSYRIAKNLGIRPYASKISHLLSELGHKTDERIRSDKFDPSRSNHLTKRQIEILQLIGNGLTNKEIADKMFLSTRTVDMHVSHILERLNCRTRTEAISKAGELNLL